MVKNKITKQSARVEAGIVKVAGETIDEVQHIVDSTEKHFEGAVEPIRKSLLKRFPILFTLAVTFGLTSTVVGMEQILLQYQPLQNNPWVILCIGMGVLVITGTLYNKLG